MHEKKERKEMSISKENKYHYYCWEYLKVIILFTTLGSQDLIPTVTHCDYTENRLRKIK